MLIAPPLLHGIVGSLTRLGLSPSALLQTRGLRPEALAAPRLAVATTAWDALWAAAEEQTAEPYLALAVGQQLYVEQLGMLGYIVRNCETLGQALQRVERYNRLTNTLVDVTHAVSQGQAFVRFDFVGAVAPPSRLHRALVLLELGFIAGGLSQLVHRPVRPLGVRCQLGASDCAELTARLGTPVVSDPARNELSFDAQLLAEPLLLPDAQLRQRLEQVADRELSRHAPQGTWADRARAVIVRRTDGERPTADTVAAELNVSTRALQRRLKAEGTGLQQLIDEVRRDLAGRYLALGYSVNEVAYLVGFAEGSAFSRAFKQWTGQRPQAYAREQHAAPTE